MDNLSSRCDCQLTLQVKPQRWPHRTDTDSNTFLGATVQALNWISSQIWESLSDICRNEILGLTISHLPPDITSPSPHHALSKYLHNQWLDVPSVVQILQGRGECTVFMESSTYLVSPSCSRSHWKSTRQEIMGLRWTLSLGKEEVQVWRSLPTCLLQVRVRVKKEILTDDGNGCLKHL